MVSLLDGLERHGSVELEGFRNQVGGQFQLLKYRDCVCKPLLLRENKFYQCLSEELKPFTATYHGVITVCFERHPTGEVQAIAYPPRQEGGLVLTKETLKASTGYNVTSQDEQRITIGSEEVYTSPWCEQCARVSAEKLTALGDQLATVQQEYIVLEDLTSRYTYPCIMDIKVGYGNHDDHGLEKKLRHLQNKERSTTATLHLRLGGMQKYDASKNEFVFHNKYYGRSLSEGGFRDELRSFLHNGVRLRTELLGPIIDMLEQLSLIIQSQHSYRFFSSSLLIIYDGADESGRGPIANGRGLEESKCSTEESEHETLPTTQQNGHDAPKLTNGFSKCALNKTTSHDDHMTSEGRTPSQQELRKLIDVRMIDFAHGVHSSFNDTPLPPGPDIDYLTGLTSLVQTLTDLLREHKAF